MKRKRGHKKGKKSKKPKVVAAEGGLNDAPPDLPSQISQENSEGDEEGDNNENESRAEADTPSSAGTDAPLDVFNVKRDGSGDNAAAKTVGRVKVKLKTSKALESDMPPSQSDTDKSSPQVAVEKPPPVAEKVEDGAVSLPVKKPVFLGQVYRKSGGIKIKSSKGLSSLNAMVDKSANAVVTKDESTVQKEPEKPNQSSRYNKRELDDALTVIKKVMKMDAAEPFNVPVNPEALGIPDYFDVIDTPMDFGTICSNIEKSDKYKNSEDVYKDVQYIWDNCVKYNKKGDYIVDLMKRVKKNFMKYWTAAGLYTEHTKGDDNAQGEDGGQSNLGKGHGKQKSHKKHGRRHKNDCLCAVCILKRRKREREESARIARGQTGMQEETSPVESPSIPDSSLNMAENVDTDAEMDEKHEEVKVETERRVSPMEKKHTESNEEADGEDDDEEEEDSDTRPKKKIEIKAADKSQFGDRTVEEPSGRSSLDKAEKLVEAGTSHTQNIRPDDDKQKQKELRDGQWRMKIFEKFQYENPMLLRLCASLFPDDDKSIWTGPHSLAKRHGSSAQTGSIHRAIKELME